MGQVQHASRFPGSPHSFVVDEKPACNETLTQLHGDSTYELRGCCWVKAPSQNTIVSIRHTETVSHAKISSGFAVSLLYEVQERFQSPQSTNTDYKEKKLRVCSRPDHQPRRAEAGCPCEGLRDPVSV